jgi:protein O-mannosyl-transferase
LKSGLLKWAVPLGLLVATLLAYAPALRGGFIWDDDYYVVRNNALRNLDGLQQIWVGVADMRTYPAPQYYPMTFTSLWIDYHLWGLNPTGYHITNLLLHVLCAWTLWTLLRKLQVPGATAAAFLFALHPINVESAAWITERKNVLSGLFFLLSALVYLTYLEAKSQTPSPSTRGEGGGEGQTNAHSEDQTALPPAPSVSTELAEVQGTGRGSSDDYKFELPKEPWKLYTLALLLFFFALTSKTVTATLPAAILVILWWKRGRLAWRDATPLLPFFALGLVFSVLTGWIERNHVGAIGAEWDYSPAQRLLIAGRAVWFYLAKLAVPLDLAFIYDKWTINAADAVQWLAPIAVASVLAGAVVLTKRWGRGLLATLLLFGGLLVPAMGFVNFFPMRYSLVANHFVYLPAMALIAGACALGAILLRRQPLAVSVAVATVVCLIMGGLTFAHARIYAGPEQIWRDTIARSPNAWMAHNNLGVLLLNENKLDEAQRHFEKALDLRKNNIEAAMNLGRVAEARGDLATAERLYITSINFVAANSRLDSRVAGRPIRRPAYTQPYLSLGKLRLDQNNPVEAEAAYAAAVAQDDSSATALSALGEVRRQLGKSAEALDLQDRALQLDRLSPQVRINLGNALMDLGRVPEARFEYGNALELDPQNAKAASNIGLTFAVEGKWTDAINMFEHALKLDPDFEQARQNLEAARRRASGQTATQPATRPS